MGISPDQITSLDSGNQPEHYLNSPALTTATAIKPKKVISHSHSNPNLNEDFSPKSDQLDNIGS